MFRWGTLSRDRARSRVASPSSWFNGVVIAPGKHSQQPRMVPFVPPSSTGPTAGAGGARDTPGAEGGPRLGLLRITAQQASKGPRPVLPLIHDMTPGCPPCDRVSTQAASCRSARTQSCWWWTASCRRRSVPLCERWAAPTSSAPRCRQVGLLWAHASQAIFYQRPAGKPCCCSGCPAAHSANRIAHTLPAGDETPLRTSSSMFVTGALMQHPVSKHLDAKVTELTKVGHGAQLCVQPLPAPSMQQHTPWGAARPATALLLPRALPPACVPAGAPQGAHAGGGNPDCALRPRPGGQSSVLYLCLQPGPLCPTSPSHVGRLRRSTWCSLVQQLNPH